MLRTPLLSLLLPCGSHILSTLLHFISCTRRSDWEGHLNTLDKITLWPLAYDCVNCSRYVPVYLHEMRQFEKTYSFAHEHLRAGEFAVQLQERYKFFATAADQVIEQTDRDGKSAGGINAVAKSILCRAQDTDGVDSVIDVVEALINPFDYETDS